MGTELMLLEFIEKYKFDFRLARKKFKIQTTLKKVKNPNSLKTIKNVVVIESNISNLFFIYIKIPANSGNHNVLNRI